MYIENIFELPTIKNKVYTFQYNYYDKKSKQDRNDSIIIDLKKYGG